MLRYQISLDLIRKTSLKNKVYLRRKRKCQKLCLVSLVVLVLLTICKNKSSRIPTILNALVNGCPTHAEKIVLEFSALTQNLSATEVIKFECKLPRLDPYNVSVLPYIRDDIGINCESKFPLLFTSTYDSYLVQIVDPRKYGLEDCCYRNLVRYRGSDSSVGYGLSKTCIPIVRNVTKVPPFYEFISIRCRNKKSGKSGAVDMLSFVPFKSEVKLRHQIQDQMLQNLQERKTVKPNKNKRKVSTVILGLDSISHMNFIRIMPKTHGYLKKSLSAIGMNGFTKIGDNTFPNAVAMLTGMNESQLQQHCWPTKRSFFDTCSFIWKEFTSQGYATSFTEDSPSMAIFNYQKRGFNNSPVDYYLRPLTFLQDKLIGNHKAINTNVCNGPRMGFEVLLEHLQKMAFTMQKHQSNYFQLTWATSLFHDYLNLGKNGDESLVKSLQWFQSSGYFENTVFILMSDHGMRWGPIRRTYQGKIEERMPFLYFVLPSWFEKEFPQAVQNLKGNADRLTTPYDLHETLRDLLYLEKLYDRSIHRNSESTPRGISLFSTISTSRKCDDAGIPSHYCVCDRGTRPIPIDNSQVQSAAKFVVSTMNKMLNEFHQCAVLTLDHILGSEILIKSQRKSLKTDLNSFALNLKFITMPSKASFEVTMESDENGFWSVQEITRTNLYGNQSSCVSDYDLKKFCFCI